MMLFVIVGISAWISLFQFEELKLKGAKNNPLFICGMILLIVSWLGILLQTTDSSSTVRICVGAAIAVIGLIAYTYVIFFAIPKESLVGKAEGEVVCAGLYKKCRHPGFYTFTVVAIGLAILGGSKVTIITAILNWLINLIYIYLQDKRYFPAYLKGYEEYKKKVPFL